MKISVRKLSKFKEFELTSDQITFNSGLLDELESVELAHTLLLAARDLIYDHPDCEADVEKLDKFIDNF